MIRVAEKGKENQGPLAKKIGKAVIAEIAKISRVIDMHSKYK